MQLSFQTARQKTIWERRETLHMHIYLVISKEKNFFPVSARFSNLSFIDYNWNVFQSLLQYL